MRLDESPQLAGVSPARSAPAFLGDRSDSEARLRAIFESEPECVKLIDPDCRLLDMNPAGLAMIGAPSLEAVRGACVLDLVCPEHREKYRAAVAEVFSGKSVQQELEVISLNGQRLWMEQHAVGLKDPADPTRITQMLAVVRDITARKQIEHELRDSRERHALLMDSVPAFISYVSASERYEWVNKAYEEWYQRPRDEIIGRTVCELQGEDNYRRIQPQLRRALQGHRVRYEQSLAQPGAEPRVFDTQYIPHVGAGGHVAGAFVLVFEVTRERAAEQSLRASEARFRGLFETSADAIFLLDGQGQICAANPAAARMHGYPVDELRGLNMRDLDVPRDAMQVADRLRHLKAGESLSFEVAHRRKDGSVFPLEVVASPLWIGAEFYVLAIDRDITERTLAEEAQRKSEAQFRLVWENATDGMRLTDAEGMIVAVNEAFCRLIGKSRQELEGQPMTVAYEASGGGEILRKHQERFHSRQVPPYLKRRLTLWNGRTVWLEVSNCFLETDPARTLLLGIFRDVTERMQAESALRESEERYRNLVELAPDGIAMFQDGKLVFANSMAAQLMQVPSASVLIGMQLNDHIHPDDLAASQERQDAILAGRSDIPPHDVRIRRPGGTYLTLEVCSGPCLHQGRAAIQLVARDVSARKQTEQTLALLNFALDHVGEEVSLIEETGKLHYVNERACRALEYSRAELLQMSVQDIDPEFPAERWPEHWRELSAAGSQLFETTHKSKSGRAYPVEVSANYFERDGRGWNLGLARDITERKRAEEQLRASEHKNSALLSALPDMMFRISRDGDFLDCRAPAGVKLLAPLDQIIGGKLHDLLPRALADQALEKLRAALATNSVQSFTYDLPEPAGQRYYEARLAVSGPDEVVAIVRDITAFELAERERRQAEEELRRSEARFSKLFYLSPCSVLVATYPEGRIVDVNHEFLRIFEFERDEVIGATTTDLGLWSDLADRAEMLERIRSGRARDMKFAFRSKSGELRTLVMSVELVELHGQLHSLAMSIDITATKQAEDQLSALRDQLAHAARVGTMGELASGLAHELNQPLAALNLYASAGLQLIRRGGAKELEDNLQFISREALRAGEIVRRMRAFVTRAARVRAAVDFSQLIHEVLAILGHDLRRSGAKLELHIEDNLPPVLADGIQIQQVLVNLIRNGLEAMAQTPAADRRLAIQAGPATAGVCVRVTDTGCGINPAIEANLFQPFQSTKPTGLGLGLAISRTLIEAHDGRIGCEPNPRGGATLFFTLPAMPS